MRKLAITVATVAFIVAPASAAAHDCVRSGGQWLGVGCPGFPDFSGVTPEDWASYQPTPTSTQTPAPTTPTPPVSTGTPTTPVTTPVSTPTSTTPRPPATTTSRPACVRSYGQPLGPDCPEFQFTPGPVIDTDIVSPVSIPSDAQFRVAFQVLVAF